MKANDQRMKSKKEIALKPCPFCGGKATADKSNCKGNLTPYYVLCYAAECPAKPSVYGATPQIAAAAWNRRKGE